MCVFVRPEISVRGARAEWCARVRADGRARAQSRKEIKKNRRAAEGSASAAARKSTYKPGSS